MAKKTNRRKPKTERKTRSGAVFSTDKRTGQREYDLTNSTNILRDMNRAIIEQTGKSGSTLKATQWFVEKIESSQMLIPDSQALTLALLRDRIRATTKVFLEMPGRMFAFTYLPKTRGQLEYYDVTPLIITLPQEPTIEKKNDNILGINLHYVEPEIRAELLDKLLRISHKHFGEKLPPKGVGYFQIEYEMLKSIKFVQGLPCVRSYDPIRILGRPVLIPSNEWGNATALPFENFVKKRTETIWLETRIKIREFIRSLGDM